MPGCVLFVLDSRVKSYSRNKLNKARLSASESKLPLAVVYCLEHPSEEALKSLLPIETDLQKINIPLIVLIGAPDTTLSGMVQHVNPLKIFYDISDQVTGLQALPNHSYAWPGKVIKVQDLIKLLKEGKISC